MCSSNHVWFTVREFVCICLIHAKKQFKQTTLMTANTATKKNQLCVQSEIKRSRASANEKQIAACILSCTTAWSIKSVFAHLFTQCKYLKKIARKLAFFTEIHVELENCAPIFFKLVWKTPSKQIVQKMIQNDVFI